MAGIRKLAPNVADFLAVASKLVGQIEAEHWNQDVFCDLVEGGMGSPIEDLFYIACRAQCVAEYTPFNPDPTEQDGAFVYPYGIYVSPQYAVGKYRADFLVQQFGIGPESVLGPVIVELDGHTFHDKDKRQRSYEKRRDRDFVRAGFRVVHFTGSDVVADPYAVAYEVLDMVGLFAGSGRESYDAAAPLGEF
jgi:very-short-patch-repair endonuclease